MNLGMDDKDESKIKNHFFLPLSYLGVSAFSVVKILIPNPPLSSTLLPV